MNRVPWSDAHDEPLHLLATSERGVDPVWWTVCDLGRCGIVEHVCLEGDG
jgi:hypothetical protein